MGVGRRRLTRIPGPELVLEGEVYGMSKSREAEI